MKVAWEGAFVRSFFTTPNIITQHNLLNEIASLVDAGILRTTRNDYFGALDPANPASAHDHIESGAAI